MSQHLVFSDEYIEKHTLQGEFNIDLLRLNNEESILYRKETIDSVISLIEIVISLKKVKTIDARSGLERAVIMLVKLTQKEEAKIRCVLKVRIPVKMNTDSGGM